MPVSELSDAFELTLRVAVTVWHLLGSKLNREAVLHKVRCQLEGFYPADALWLKQAPTLYNLSGVQLAKLLQCKVFWQYAQSIELLKCFLLPWQRPGGYCH